MGIDKIYPADISVLLKPILFPTGRIGINNMLTDITLTDETWFHFKCSGSTETKIMLQVEHCGKSNRDPDTAIIIEQIKFNNITSPKFAWQGVYYPNYPEHYRKGEVLDSVLSSVTHMGWNGIWKLEFTLPIYTWIHQVENLGWIYD